MSHAAAPVFSNAAPSESAPPKKMIKPQSTPFCASLHSITLNMKNSTAPIKAMTVTV